MSPGRLARLLIGIGVVAFVGYFAYATYESSRQLVEAFEPPDCRTPMVAYGWAYEPINYDPADDADLARRFPGMTACTDQGGSTGTDVVSVDGIQIDGWFIPAGSGDPDAATVVISGGYGVNKSGTLPYMLGLHQDFNLVAFDNRNMGRSGGTQTTVGVLERFDLAAILDWLEREKGVTRVGILGNSMGAASAITLMRTDQRIVAIVLDSAHARVTTPMAYDIERAGHPAYPGVWATILGAWLRTGANVGDADPINAVPDIGSRPVLIIHGRLDPVDPPAETAEVMFAALRAAGTPVELTYCEGAGHGGLPGFCGRDYERWVADFFGRAL